MKDRGKELRNKEALCAGAVVVYAKKEERKEKMHTRLKRESV